MLTVVVALVLCAAGCTNRGAEFAVRSLPGTEQVAIYDFSISVSPDERWLAFTEWTLPKDRVFKELPLSEFESRIATLNLKTGELVRHPLNSISAEALGFSSSDVGWIGQAGLEVIEQRFRPPGWREGVFYFQPYFQGMHVALRPDRPGLEVLGKPSVRGACSDFLPIPNFTFRGRAWDLRSNEASAVFDGEAIRCVYYRGGRPRRTCMILRQCLEGEEEVVVDKEKKSGTHMSITCIRVSPDERYLAYVVRSKKQAFLAGPRETVYIRNLITNREAEIATYGYVGNLMWSPAGERLYFAGGGYSSDSAIRVVDVKAPNSL